MYVKYVMLGPTDYRGNVALVVASPQGQDIAYSSVDATDDDMIPLVEEEVRLVREESGISAWLTARDEHRKKLDELADSVRESYKYPGHYSIDMEYAQVELALNAWKERGSPVDDVPDEIQVWQDVTGNDLAWVVNNIETSISQHRGMIAAVRRLRLTGKKALETAVESQIVSTYNQYASQLEAIRAVPDY